MKQIGPVLLLAGSIVLSVRATAQGDKAPVANDDVKSILTTLPSGQPVRFEASSINRDLSNSVVYLRGNASVEIWLKSKPTTDSQVMFLRADTVQYNEKSGEMKPYGDVRVTVREPQ